MRWQRPSRQTIERTHGGKFQKVQMREVILATADDGGINDAVTDHLQGAVQRNQRSGAGGGDRIAGSHETITVADEAGGGAVEPTQKRGVVRSHAPGFYFANNGALLFWSKRHGSLDVRENVIHVSPDDQASERACRFAGVLGNEHANALARDA